MPIEIKAYECEYCGKISRSRSNAKSHEARCHWNPKNLACASCGNSDDFYCHKLGENLRVKGGLKSGCESWSPRENEA